MSTLQGMLSTFDPDEFFSRPNTVHVVAASDAATDGVPLAAGLVEELRLAALRISDPSGALPIPWLLALHEVATICPCPSGPACSPRAAAATWSP